MLCSNVWMLGNVVVSETTFQVMNCVLNLVLIVCFGLIGGYTIWGVG
jgi:hypothetical protein